MRYASETWLAVPGVIGLLQRPGGAFLYRRRVKGRLYRAYLGRIPQIDAEQISELLYDTPPARWPRLIECTKAFFWWEWNECTKNFPG